MSDFKAKTYQIQFRLGPQTPLGEPTALNRPPSCIKGRVRFAGVGGGGSTLPMIIFDPPESPSIWAPGGRF